MNNFLHSWTSQVKGYNRNVRLFFIASILCHIGLGMITVIYHYYIRELGFDEQMNGKVIAMMATAQAVMLLPAGMLSDKFGRKKAMIIGAFFSALIFMLRAILTAESVLLITAFASGLCMAFVQVSMIPLLAENSAEKQRVHLFSFNFAIIMVANVVGNTLGGVLADLFQVVPSLSMLQSIRMTLLIGATFYLISLIPFMKMREKAKKAKDNEGVSYLQLVRSNKKGLKIIFLFAIANILIGFGSGLVIPYLNLYFTDRFAISKSLVGIILSLGQAMTAVALLIGPAVVQRLGEVRAVVYFQLLSIPFLLLTAYSQNLLLAVIGFLFRQALMNAGNPIQMSLMMKSVDDSMKGLANSIGQMVFHLGWAVMGPVSTGIVMMHGSYYGYAFVFSITAVLYVISSCYFYFMFRNFSSKQVPKQAQAISA